MVVTPDTILALVQVYLQTLGLSLLFVGTGSFLYRTWLAREVAAEPLSLSFSRAFFLGLSVFLLLFVLLSRAGGSARIALWLCLAVMGSVSLWQLVTLHRQPRAWGWAWPLLTALLFLVGAYSITNATLWLDWNPTGSSPAPALMSHCGSIHSGRYANYAICMAEQDRVPFLAQNAGQSMLCAVHLLLGADCPLASLMVWVPFSLAFLTLLLFGFFRAQQFAFVPCVAGTFLVLYCNVALSLVHVLLFDNGSPVAFIGYSDLIIGVATFLLLSLVLRDALAAQTRARWSSLVWVALLGVTWCWYAPQNIVIGSVAYTAAALAWWWRYHRQGFRPLRTLAPAAVVFAASVALGGTQLGAFLPRTLQEDVGGKVFLIGSGARIRPYTQYTTSHWTGMNWNFDLKHHRLYEDAYRLGAPIGADEIVRRMTGLFENHLWATLRNFCFPLLGLFLLWITLRTWPSPEADRERYSWRAWWLVSLFAFATGFAISYGFELGGFKWLLTRFLVPGSVLALLCLACAILRKLQQVQRGMRVTLWGLLLVFATFGPMFELATTFYRNHLIGWHIDPLGHRLNLMVQTKGPYLE